ncbi:MAG: tail fiber domain-containing protein [Ignavibacteriae bacterium]|nr:tail fiber domain-containing protein [Ignavibacteriota bacterium]
MKTLSLFLILLALLFAAIELHAQIPRTLSYQGVLTDTAGNPRPDGSYQFTFRLYDVSTGGTAKWTEQKTLSVAGGLFYTTLGDQVAIPDTIRFDRAYWLGIQVVAEPELSPRDPLTSVGYSFSSIRSDTAQYARSSSADTTWSTSGSNIYRLSGNVGIGTASPMSSLEVTGGGAIRVSGLSQFEGEVPGAGAQWNLGTFGDPEGTIYGFSRPGTVHLAIDVNSGNVGIGTTNPSYKLDVNGTINAGKGSFGSGNINTGTQAFVAGSNNLARGDYSVVSGGGGSSASDSNSALGDYSTVSGGLSNKASGFRSTVGGGDANTASGFRATVPGGHFNAARGDYSFAAGYGARANHDYAVVIAANLFTGFASDTVASGGAAQMVLLGGAGFYLTNTPGVASIPAGRFLNTSTGAYLTTGGVWTNASDRNAKENFQPVNGEELLKKVALLPISQWNYKNEKPEVKHIGPMAQDFYRIFHLGEDEKTISTIDPAGIALAAIQELYKKSLEVNDLKAQVNRLQQMVQTLSSELKSHAAETTDGSR